MGYDDEKKGGNDDVHHENNRCSSDMLPFLSIS